MLAARSVREATMMTSNSPTPSPTPDRMTRFERAIVFRVARGYFFAMALLAVAIFVGGAVIGTRGLASHEIPAPVHPAAPPPRRPIDLNAIIADLEREKARAAQAASTIELKPQSGQTAHVAAAEDDDLDRAVKAVRALFPDPPYSWENEVERTCSVPTSFGCLQWGTHVRRFGVVGALSKAFEGMDREEVIDYLGVLADVLKRAPVERRLELVSPIIQAERDGRADYQARLNKHKHQLEEIDANYQTAVDLDKAKHAEWRQSGLYALAIGFGLMITVSLFLAFLSMERHTRALERLLGPGTLLATDPSPSHRWTSNPIATTPGTGGR